VFLYYIKVLFAHSAVYRSYVRWNPYAPGSSLQVCTFWVKKWKFRKWL